MKKETIFTLSLLFSIYMFTIQWCEKPTEPENDTETENNSITSFVKGYTYYASTKIPLSGVLIAIGEITYTTGSNGYYQLDEVPIGQKTISATKTDFGSYSQTINITSDGLEHDIELTSTVYTFSIYGEVINYIAENLPNVNVSLLDPDSSKSELWTTTDNNGTYSLPSVPQGNRILRFSKIYYNNLDAGIYLYNHNIQFDAKLVASLIDPPTDFVATFTPQYNILLEWEGRQEPTVKGYNIYRSTSNDEYLLINSVLVDYSNSEYIDTNISHDIEYNYKISSVNIDNNEGFLSDKISILPIPDPPTNFSAEPISTQKIKLTWKAREEPAINGYNIYRSIASEGDYIIVNQTLIDRLSEEYIDGNLSTSTRYYYKISSINNDKIEGDLSDYISSVTFGTVTDIDGNTYKTIKIGDQTWTAENLKVTHYRNGDAIPKVSNDSIWVNLITGAYCAYDNEDSNVETYGYLYNWYAVDDVRNIAPEGWHVPTDDEWKLLEMYLGMSQSESDDTGWRGTDEGGKLKKTGTAHWQSPNTGATNESGFSALPGGYRYHYNHYNGNFDNKGTYASFWSSTEGSSSGAFGRSLLYSSSKIARSNSYFRRLGYSVRLVRD